MDINIGGDEKIEIGMRGQLEEVIYNFQRDIGATATSPVASHVLTVDKHCEKLREERSETFHSVTDKSLYITK